MLLMASCATTREEITEPSPVNSSAVTDLKASLTSIVGPGITGKTYTDSDGTQYNVKNVGIVEYYMKYWFTDL